jgi:glycosyltransferase involved in cell wall biosynthesis
MLEANRSAESAAAAGISRASIAVLVPCYNEERTVRDVVTGFRAALPSAEIYVYDNNSTDGTVEAARAAGAIVRTESHQGKGHVVRRMFADIEADVYVLVDGDATYDAPSAERMVASLLEDNLDMVVAVRVDREEAAYRSGHRTGNRLITGFVAHVFGRSIGDMLSGYRAFSRRFVKSFPVLSGGFEIETELTVHALELRMPFAELPVRYRSRPEGSHSKLSTYRDGWRILRTICKLFVSERPLLFFSGIATVMALGSIAAAVPLALTYLATGLVPRLPTAVLLTGTMLTAMLAFVCGIVLHAVTMGRREAKRLRYLAIPGVLHRGPVERP